ncbi:5482_t:CDS:2 [Acaulospora colombiana]|uniref:5482_t:CDS:1 n=1 Tax=Acaulospora colombiana TaxID=27376 RepID=A0ACA9L0C7_9GLOM|nr:5482_t:CDS:2 [Acaulospora colombiana]
MPVSFSIKRPITERKNTINIVTKPANIPRPLTSPTSPTSPFVCLSPHSPYFTLVSNGDDISEVADEYSTHMIYDIDPSGCTRGKHILGATGQLGIQIVNQALESSYHVTALVRSDLNLPFTRHQLRNPNLVIMVGSVFDRQDLDKVIEGQDAVINCIGPQPLFGNNTDICSRSQKMIIESMIENKVRRLIAVTMQGIGTISGVDNSTNSNNSSSSSGEIRCDTEDRPTSPTVSQIPVISKGWHKLFGKLFSNKVLNDKELQERIIMENNDFIDYTIIRPGRLTNGTLTETYKVMEHDDVRRIEKDSRTTTKRSSIKISRADVAHFIMGEIRCNRWVGKTLVIES